jgi:hypothetical protein
LEYIHLEIMIGFALPDRIEVMSFPLCKGPCVIDFSSKLVGSDPDGNRWANNLLKIEKGISRGGL